MVKPALSAVLFNDRESVLALEAISGAGFGAVELVANGPYSGVDTAQARRATKQGLSRLGLVASALHAPYSSFKMDLARLDEGYRRQGVATVIKALGWAAELEAATVVVHLTQSHSESPKVGLSGMGRTVEAAYRSLAELVPAAEKFGVRIAVENVPDMRPELERIGRPIIEMRELRTFLAGFPPQWVGLCLDTGHAVLNGLDPIREARIAGDRLIATHLQDSTGLGEDSHLLPGNGIIDWKGVIRALVGIGYSGYWTFELTEKGPDSLRRAIAASASRIASQWSLEMAEGER